jgi:hypothetical protein
VSVVSSPDHLWRHVLDGAAKRVRPPLLLVRLKLSAEAKVREHNVTFAVEKNVLELDVAVDDAVLVEVLEGEDNLADVDANLVLGELFALVEVREQLAAVNVI